MSGDTVTDAPVLDAPPAATRQPQRLSPWFSVIGALLLARLLDDKPMAVRDKGPLFIIYPFDQHEELRTALYLSRCAWQLKAIEVQ